MEVRTCTSARVAAQTDNFTGPYFLSFAYELGREVPVDGLQTVAVPYNDVFAVSSALVSYDAHFAGEGGTYRVADVNFDVKTFMVTSEL